MLLRQIPDIRRLRSLHPHGWKDGQETYSWNFFRAKVFELQYRFISLVRYAEVNNRFSYDHQFF
jgi:hypothetical protein